MSAAVSTPEMLGTLRPAVWLSSRRTVTPSASKAPDGTVHRSRYRFTGASNSIRPASASRITPHAVRTLEIEPTWNMVSPVTG